MKIMSMKFISKKFLFFLLLPLAMVFSLFAALPLTASAYVPPSPTIYLDIDAGGPGQAVIVTGINFSYNASVEITINGELMTTATTNASGAFTASFEMPAYAVATANYTILATDQYDLTASAVFAYKHHPVITLSPTSGQTGTEVTVTGTYYRPNVNTIRITFNSTEVLTGVQTDDNGSFTATFSVPSSAVTPGPYTVIAHDTAASDDTGSRTFTIVPKITLDIDAGGPGQAVIVTGINFSFNASVEITINGELMTTASTGASGAFTASFNMPAYAVATANYTVLATDQYGRTASAVFAYTKNDPVITLSPTSGQVGTEVTVTGTYYRPNVNTIRITFGATEVLTGVQTDDNGSFTATFSVPSSAVTPGPYTIVAHDTAASGDTASRTFTVVKITLDLYAGGPGQAVTVTGINFSSNASVEITINGELMTTATTNASGAFTASFEMPAYAVATANYTVLATDQYGRTASAVFAYTAPIYTITFNANGGTVTPSTGTTGTDGKLTSLPTPSRSGYTFNGWFTSLTGGTRITANYLFSGNTTIYAQWTPLPTYTVTFNPDGGTVSPTSSVTGTNGRLGSLPTPTKDGYTFSGWFTSLTGGTQVTTNYVYYINTTIYARWTPLPTYTITFNANSGTVTPSTGTTGTDGKLTSLPTPSRSGYTFNGWFTSLTGGTQVTVSHVFNADTTIYAQWSQITYSVTYNGNGHTGGSVPIDSNSPYASGSSVMVLGNSGNLVRTGYTFKGWSTSANGALVTSFTISSNAVLYAVWELNPPVITPPQNTDDSNNTVWLWAGGALLLGLAGAGVFFFIRSRKG